jgi:alcohol dehydrogenase (cytochrome c)
LKYGGAPTWRSGSYDPQLDLVYWGTGNAEPYDPRPREGLDSLFASTMLAIRPKTGEIACFYQYTPNDVYDVDGTDEHLLADVMVGGQMRKVMIQANKNGFLYVIDRTNCRLVAAHPYTKVNWASRVDLETGRPVLTDLYKRFLAGDEVEIYPSRGTNAVPIAFDPRTGLIYVSTWDVPRIQKLAPPKPQVIGEPSTGVIARQPVTKPGEIVGYFVAMNPVTGEKKWETPLAELPSSAGMLATAGGLVFSGKMTGEFVALDAASGKTLWQFKTGSSLNSTAITYTYRGRQYVSVTSGLGGTLANRYASTKVPTGGSVWTFALMQE